MAPRRTTRQQAYEWLLAHLELVEQDPDVIEEMPLDDVREVLHRDYIDCEASVERVKARFAAEEPASREAAAASRPARPPARRTRWVWGGVAAVAVLLVALGLLWMAGPGATSEPEQLVALDTYASEIEATVAGRDVTKAPGTGWSALEEGWDALRRARRQPLGLPLGYDDEAARQSIEHLEVAYRSGKSARRERIDGDAKAAAGPPQGLVAFLAAQAYLIVEDVEQARFWLQTAAGFDEEPWRSAALRLLEQLPASAS